MHAKTGKRFRERDDRPEKEGRHWPGKILDLGDKEKDEDAL